MGDEADAMWQREMVAEGYESVPQPPPKRRKPIKRAVIKRIAKERRVSLAVASHIYNEKPIAMKQRICAAEERRIAGAGQ